MVVTHTPPDNKRKQSRSVHSFSPLVKNTRLPKRKNLINFNCIILLNYLSRIHFHSKKKKSNQNRKLLGINKTIQTLREFYPTTNTLLSMSREVSAVRYHAQGCCKATCKAPSCVPRELPAATASEHFKASDPCKRCSHRQYIPATPLQQAAQQSKAALTQIHVWLSLLLNTSLSRCLCCSAAHSETN